MNIRDKYNNLKLRDKILYYSVATMIFIHLSFVFYSRETIKRITIEEAEISTQKNMDIVRNSMAFMFTSVKSKIAELSFESDVTSNLYDYYDDNNNIATIRRNLINIINHNLGISSIITGMDVVLNNGQIIHTSPIKDVDVESLIEKSDLNDREYSPYTWEGPIRLEHYNGIEEYYFVIKKRIIDVDTSKQLGMLYAYISESDFRELYESVFDEDTDQFIIVKKDGTIVSAGDKSLIGQEIYSIINMVDADLNAGYEYKIRNNNDEFILTNHVAENQFQIISIRKNRELEKSAKEINRFLMYFTLGYLVLIFVVNTVLANQLASPLSDLVAVMSRIKSGERSLRVNLGTTDEFRILGTSFNELMDSNEQLIEDVYRTQEEIRLHELRTLNEQIKPHFLYNTLGTISSLVKLKMYDEAIDTVQNLASFFRVFLNEGNTVYTLENEIQMIESYLTIQRYRYSNILGFTVDIDPEILNYSIPKLLLQPLVENAIYHGVKSREEKTKIEVRSFIQLNEIVLSVKDYGEGISKKKLFELNESMNKKQHTEYFGLRSVNQRIQLRYGSDYGVVIDSKEKEGTEVSIRLPKVQVEDGPCIES